jgi:hypothetical protein
VWNGQCGGSASATSPTTTVPVTGLQAGTTYNVVLRITQLDGTTRNATATLTMPAAAQQAVVGDLNGDRKVDCQDVNILKSQYGQTGAGHSGDLNKDQKVDATDLSMLLSRYDGGEQAC